MTISELYKMGINILKDNNISSAKTDVVVLLCFCLNCTRSFLYTYPEKDIPDITKTNFLKLIKKRANHKPLQYLTNVQEFMSLDFFVNKNVLIPRQDTEILVEEIIKLLKFNTDTTNTISLLDIGTGSGCISISLAKYIPNLKVTAVDISKLALSVAIKNAKLNQVEEKISFIQSDLFDNIQSHKFDVIVSNPPYIPSKDISSLSPEVNKNEPLNALDGGLDGLDFYRKIINQAPKHLFPGGILAFECGINQSENIRFLMQHNFSNIHIVKDLSNISRALIGYC